MSYQDFLELVVREMGKVAGPEETVTVHTILKNNGIRMKAMSIRCKDKEVCPIIYMAPFYRMYRSGRPLEEILCELQNIYRMDGDGMVDKRLFFSFQLAKEYLAFRLVGYRSNEEMLKLLPHRRFLDLAVIYCLSLKGKNGCVGSALVYQDHAKSWGVSEEGLFAAASANAPRILPASLESLDTLLGNCLLSADAGIEHPRKDVYVISNPFGFYGAASVLYPGVLSGLAGRLGADLYLLPGSVHEFLALSVSDGMETAELGELVRSINQTHLAPDEVLSDNVYRYDRKTDRMAVASV